MTEHIQVVPDKCRACRRCEVACIAAHHGMTFKEAMACIPKGFIAMVPAILILVVSSLILGSGVDFGALFGG